MREFIKVQYGLYKSGVKSIGIERIKQLADIYMSESEIAELFGEGGDEDD